MIYLELLRRFDRNHYCNSSSSTSYSIPSSAVSVKKMVDMFNVPCAPPPSSLNPLITQIFHSASQNKIGLSSQEKAIHPRLHAPLNNRVFFQENPPKYAKIVVLPTKLNSHPETFRQSCKVHLRKEHAKLSRKFCYCSPRRVLYIH